MIDKTNALNVFNIAEAEYDGLLAEFVAQADERVRSLAALLEKGDLDAARRVTHSLKGVSGNLRLERCFEAAKKMDAAAVSKDLALLRQEVARFEEAVAEVRAALP